MRDVRIAQGSTILMRLLSRDYFVVLALSPEGNFGRGRFELRKAELQLAKSLLSSPKRGD